MFDQFTFGREFFEELEVLDRAIARRVAASRCPVCGARCTRATTPASLGAHSSRRKARGFSP